MRFIAFSLLFVLGITANGQVLETRAKILQALYDKLRTAQAKSSQHAFFAAFPGDFKEFYGLYGSGGTLTSNHQDFPHSHIINGFGSLTAINDTIYYAKLVKLSVEGVWEADGVNIFQHVLIEKVEKKPLLAWYSLKKYNKRQIDNFWLFFFEGPHPQEISTKLKEFKKIDSHFYQAILAAHDKAVKMSEH